MFPFLPAVLAALPTGPGAAVALATSAEPKGKKKDKRGGNRFVPVVATDEVGEEVHDADPA